MSGRAQPLPARLAAGFEVQSEMEQTVLLRSLRAADAGAFAEHIASDLPRLRAHLPWPDGTATPEGAERWLGGYERREDGRVVALGAWAGPRLLGGAVLLHHQPEAAIVEIGCWVIAEAAGRGVAAACCRELIALARRELRAERVEWHASPENAASVGLAQRLGFKREGTLRSAYVLRGERQDVVLLSLVESELDAF